MSVVCIDHSVVLWQVQQTNTVVKHDLNSELTSDLPSLPPSTLALGQALTPVYITKVSFEGILIWE